MATFSITRLVDSRAIIAGTDVFNAEGRTTVDTTQWDEISENSAYDKAAATFEAEVEEFFRPLTEAAEKMNKSVETEHDAINYVVLDEGREAVSAKPKSVVKLSHDSVLLRLVEQGDFDRLVWVDDQLEVLAESGAGIFAQDDNSQELAADADPS